MNERLLPGFAIGQVSDRNALTGTTVVLCEAGATPGMDARGAAPGTRETDLMRPENLVDRCHAVVLSGGSAFGLAAADGVVRWLYAKGCGWPTSAGPVPIVGAAILYDLSTGDGSRRPDAEMGFAACEAAVGEVPDRGSAGAGTGATVAKALGPDRALMGGTGFAVDELAGGVAVQAIAAVNAFGGVIDPERGELVAGPRGKGAGEMRDPIEVMRNGEALEAVKLIGQSTTLGVLMTNAELSKQQATRLAVMAQAGIARAVFPSYTMSDGDIVFVLASNQHPLQPGELSSLGAVAADAMSRAVVDGVRRAKGTGDIPSAAEWAAAHL
jgi:L-aminopeptidase/D-esterase-like protein